MRYRGTWAAAGLLLLPIAATAQPNGGAGSDRAVACDAFQHQPLGAWTVLRATTIAPDGVTMELPAGLTFAAGETYEDVDITAILDRYCGSRS
jgi:hypothetical protein